MALLKHPNRVAYPGKKHARSIQQEKQSNGCFEKQVRYLGNTSYSLILVFCPDQWIIEHGIQQLYLSHEHKTKHTPQPTQKSCTVVNVTWS